MIPGTGSINGLDNFVRGTVENDGPAFGELEGDIIIFIGAFGIEIARKDSEYVAFLEVIDKCVRRRRRCL